MGRILRSLGAVVAGAIVATILIFGLQMISLAVYRPPPEMDWNDPAQVNAFMDNAPIEALAIVLVAYAVGTFVGAWMAAWLAGRAPMVHALIIGGLLLAAGIVNLKQIPHPLWFSVVNLVEFPLMAFLAGMLAGRRRQEQMVR